MFDNSIPLLEILARTAIIYAAILIGLRLTGKRAIGQMTAFDLVVILLIANAVQNAMVGPDVSVTGGLVAAVVLLGLDYLVGVGREHIPFFNRLVQGEPTVLVQDGKVLYRNLSKEEIDLDLVLMAMREHGIGELKEVQVATLETDGSISIVPVETAGPRKTVRRRSRAVRRP
jgi:Predicted membrane protein